MAFLEIKVQGDEVLLRLDNLPRNIRAALRRKFHQIFDDLDTEILKGVPGKYIDPKNLKSGVEELGSLIIGFVEGEDKPGVYSIYPHKGNLLRFLSKSGELVFAPRVLAHPFPKAVPIIERYLQDHKPWIVEQIESAIEEEFR